MLDTEIMYKRIFREEIGGGGGLHNFTIADFRDHLLVSGGSLVMSVMQV